MIVESNDSPGKVQSYRIIKLDEIEKTIPPLIKKASELLGLNEDKAISVLRHFQWNYAKLED